MNKVKDKKTSNVYGIMDNWINIYVFNSCSLLVN